MMSRLIREQFCAPCLKNAANPLELCLDCQVVFASPSSELVLSTEG